MKRGRLLARLGLAAAVVAASVTAAALLQQSSSTQQHDATNASSSHHARDELTPTTRSGRELLVNTARGLRSDLLGHTWRDGMAVLVAGLVALALRRRAGAAVSTTHSSLWHGTTPLGRGPPRFAAT